MGGGIDKIEDEMQGCRGLDSPVNFPTGGAKSAGGGAIGRTQETVFETTFLSPLSEWPALTLAAAIGGMEKRRR